MLSMKLMKCGASLPVPVPLPISTPLPS